MVQNRELSRLTDTEVRSAFKSTPYDLTNHAISRLLDSRTSSMGVKTLNDVAGVLNNGVIENAGGGMLSIRKGNFGAVIDPNSNAIITFRPIE